eukprot:GHVO01013837.1.p1 GENE.GHVO01013837.1~~GHVO01013837.1.p1  ORF type:complete len:164 (+),score=37.92 GHVO01013837.1:31-492(+)
MKTVRCFTVAETDGSRICQDLTTFEVTIREDVCITLGHSPFPPLPIGRQYHNICTAPDKTVVIIGGTSEGVGILKSVLSCTENGGVWDTLPCLHVPRMKAASCFIGGGCLMSAGGISNDCKGALRSVEMFHFGHQNWMTMPPRRTPDPPPTHL